MCRRGTRFFLERVKQPTYVRTTKLFSPRATNDRSDATSLAAFDLSNTYFKPTSFKDYNISNPFSPEIIMTARDKLTYTTREHIPGNVRDRCDCPRNVVVVEANAIADGDSS